jgi:hypothetical protein
MADAETDDDFPVSWLIQADEEPLSGEQAAAGAKSSMQLMFARRRTAPGAAGREGGHTTTG